MKLLWAITGISLLYSQPSFGYTDGTVLVLATGTTTLTVTNSGSLGGSQVVTLPVGAGQKGKIWFSVSGSFSQRGAESPCPDPCEVILNTELGRIGYLYEITNSSGSSLNPVRQSSWHYLNFTQKPAATAPFTVPVAVHGFKDYTAAYSFTIPGGTDVSSLRVYLRCQNCRPGMAAVLGNTGVEHFLTTTYLIGFTSNGSLCTGTTREPHGLSTGDVIQQNFFMNAGTVAAGLPAGIASMNGLFTVTSTPSPKTYTIACSLGSGDYNTGFGTLGQNAGKTVSKTVYYSGEDRYFGGMDSPFHTTHLMVPMGASEFTAGATNTLSLRFKGADGAFIQNHGLVHGWRALNFNVVQPDKTCTQIVVTGANAVATCAGHGYSVGDTVLIQNAPGPGWRFNGYRILTAVTAQTFTFAWGPDSGAGSAPYLTANGTYTVPTSNDTAFTPQPVMSAARCLIRKTDFVEVDPATYSGFGGNVANGFTAFTTATLKDPNPYFPNASLATCSGCHTKNGYDLKFFAYEPIVIKIAAMHRGVTETQANDIVEYILSLPYTPTAKARPWNPPYQPAPGLDAKTIEEWKAGGGLEWILTYDTDMKEYLIPGGSYANWAYNGTINNRENPVPIQLPLWHKWLPEVHPADFCAHSLGCNFSSLPLSTIYEGFSTSLVIPQVLASGVNNSTTTFTTTAAMSCTSNDYLKIDQEYVQVTAGCGTTNLTVVRGRTVQGVASAAASHSSGAYLSDYTAFSGSGGPDTFMTNLFTTGTALFDISYESKNLLGSQANMGGVVWPSMYNRSGIGSIAWLVTKYFELFTTYKLEDMNDTSVRAYRGLTSISANAGPQYTRGWFNLGIFNRGPHKKWGSVWNHNFDHVNTPRYFNYETVLWYHLANVLTLDDRLNSIGGAIDWPYTYNYTVQISNYRPFYHLSSLWHPIQVQQSMGFATPYVSIAGVMSLHSINRLGQTFEARYLDLFSSQTDVGNFVRQVTSNMAAIIPLFTTAQWQDFMGPSGLGQCALNAPVNIPTAPSGGCPSSGVAYALPFMTYYGASAGDISTIVNWANAVWASTGHNFQNDANATCSFYVLEPPQYLKCSNF